MVQHFLADATSAPDVQICSAFGSGSREGVQKRCEIREGALRRCFLTFSVASAQAECLPRIGWFAPSLLLSAGANVVNKALFDSKIDLFHDSADAHQPTTLAAVGATFLWSQQWDSVQQRISAEAEASSRRLVLGNGTRRCGLKRLGTSWKYKNTQAGGDKLKNLVR